MGTVVSVIEFTPPLALVVACMIPAFGLGVLLVKAARVLRDRARDRQFERQIAEMSDERLEDMLTQGDAL
jgi:hypothetical protein